MQIVLAPYGSPGDRPQTGSGKTVSLWYLPQHPQQARREHPGPPGRSGRDQPPGINQVNVNKAG